MSANFSAFELEPGATYEVTSSFEDYDGGTHPAGESWRFLSHNYFPYDAGLTLYISSLGDPQQKEQQASSTTIRLQDYPESQGPVIAAFSEYVRRLES